MKAVDLSRRFRELTKSELEDSEVLLSLADAGLLKSMSWSDVILHPRVVLLAEAGSGKTFEMGEQARHLRADGKPAFFLPLEALDEATIGDLLTVDDEQAFNSWRTDDQSTAFLFLDAVDELKLTQGKLERVLRRVAKEIDGCLHRVHIVISCRPTDWRSSLDLAALRDAFPTAPLSRPAAASEELFLSALREPGPAKQSDKDERSKLAPGETSFVMLLPLDQTQIEAFARAHGLADVAAFMAELRKENAWSFARRPLDLSELIATWRGQGRLGTRAEQHEANVVARLKDQPDRPDQGLLTDVELRLGAERLALALSLTRTLTIRAPELSVDVDYVLGVLDSALVLPDWSEDKRQALLRRALFDPATYGRVKFHHRSVQEYLAARRLEELRKRGMSTKALCRLLFAERYGVPVVIPSMRPIAAWLALWDRHVQRELIRREPETLLSMGDPESLPIPIRAELLRGFAQCYGSGGWRGLRIPLEEVRRLAHPELGSVVLELWGQGPTNEDVRELLLDLMDQGRMHQCVGVCEQAACDVNLPEHQRAMAVRVLVTCGQEVTVQKIAKSIVDDPTSWPAASVAALIGDLFPSALTAADVIRLVGRSSGQRERSAFAQALRRIATDIEPLSSSAVGRNRDSNHRNVWDRDALALVFGTEVAGHAQVAFRQLWRGEQPSLWSERASQERNGVLYTWVYGLCGIAAEAGSPGWATRLSAEEARLASSYAPIELNGLPAWLKDLVAAHPSAVEDVLGKELEAELALTAEQQYLPLLQSVAYADAELKRLLAARVLQGLERWPEAFASEQASSSSRHHLDQALRIIDGITAAEDRESVATTCEKRFKKAPLHPLAMVWLRGVFRFAPDRGIAVLHAGLATTPEPERPTLAIAALAGIFGERGSMGLDLASLSERALVLGALVRIAYEFVRPADDQQHEEVYSPNARDEAERARAFLLSALLDTPGAEAQRIVLDLSASPLVAQFPDRLRLLARERAAKDAERSPLTPPECVALEQRYEAPPHDRDGLFEVMVDRLDDLAIDISDHDFSDRRTLQTIADEVEMQRALARRLEGMARGAYTVTRESEVADAKRTDIRLAAVRGEQKATVEIKICRQRMVGGRS